AATISLVRQTRLAAVEPVCVSRVPLQREARERRAVLGVLGALGRDDHRIDGYADIRPLVRERESELLVGVELGRVDADLEPLAGGVLVDPVSASGEAESLDRLDGAARIVVIADETALDV